MCRCVFLHLFMLHHLCSFSFQRLDCHHKVLRRRDGRSCRRGNRRARDPTISRAPRESPGEPADGLGMAAVEIEPERQDRRRPPNCSSAARDSPDTVDDWPAAHAVQLGLAGGFDSAAHNWLHSGVSTCLYPAASRHEGSGYGIQESEWPTNAYAAGCRSQVQAGI